MKLTDLAKETGLQSKDLFDIIGLDASKKQTALTDDQLDLMFEKLTRKFEVESLDSYFATQKKTPKKAEPKPEQKPAQAPKVEQKPAQAPNGQQRPANKFEQRPNQAQNGQQRPANKFEQRPNQAQYGQQRPNQQPKANNYDTSQILNSMKQNQPQKPFQKKEGFTPRPQGQGGFNNKFQQGANNRDQKPFNYRTDESGNAPVAKKVVTLPQKSDGPKERVVRNVDTRTSIVNLDKYNERYDKLASNNKMAGDNQFTKQKFNNKKAHQRPSRKITRETEAQKLQRLELERARKQQLKVLIPDEIVVSELASRLKVTASDVVKKLIGLGVMASLSDIIDFDTASLVALELGAKVEKEVIVTIEERLFDETEDTEENLDSRSPIVVVMGHVDHGKTSLLDKIRDASVTSSEAGGITQHIGAYKVNVRNNEITFLDTPGHEAFTSMRQRGASLTDIAILVVAADDGIMPQTVEAINHAKAAGVSIIIAINKMDKPNANPERVKQELTEHELVPEEWGGDTIVCNVSALTGEGIDNLLEMVLLLAETKELKANADRLAKGTVIEARLDAGKGPVATLLVQNGTLKTGDVLIAGTSVGRVRVMMDDKGQIVETAGPSTPVEITGLSEVPTAGDIFNAVENEKLARTLVDKRRHEQKEETFKLYQKVTLENLFDQIEQGQMKELPVIVKADVQGSAEAVKQSLEKLTTEEVRVRVIHTAVGAVTKSDVMLANVSGAIIVGFNVRPDPIARNSAVEDGVEIKLYRIIYDAIDEIKQAMLGMHQPKFREVAMGRAEVRAVYKISTIGTIAGCYVLDGKVMRNALIRVVRDGIVITEEKIDSLKRFKDDVKEVATGYECGIGLEKFNDIREGDILESFIMEQYTPKA